MATEKIIRLTKKGVPDRRSLTSKENVSKGRIAVKSALQETYSKNIDSDDGDTDSETESDSSSVKPTQPPPKKEKKKSDNEERFQKKLNEKLKEKEELLLSDFEKKMKIMEQQKNEEVNNARRGVLGAMRQKMSCQF